MSPNGRIYVFIMPSDISLSAVAAWILEIQQTLHTNFSSSIQLLGAYGSFAAIIFTGSGWAYIPEVCLRKIHEYHMASCNPYGIPRIAGCA